MCGEKAMNSSQANKERAFHVHMLVETSFIFKMILHNNTLYNCSSASGLFLIFHQSAGLRSYKTRSAHINYRNQLYKHGLHNVLLDNNNLDIE